MECEISNCGSRQFQIGEDGFTYCSEGHRQSQTGLVTAEEDEGLQPTGRRTIRKETQDDDDTALTGREGFEHYLVCFQLILRKQARSFIDSSKAPRELEDIIRDLWILRLNALSDRLASNEDDKQVETQLFSSQNESSDPGVGDSIRSTDKSDRTLLSATDGLSMIYLATMLLHLPLLPVDFHHMVQNGAVLYYRAIKDLDTGMTAKLEGRYHYLLDPTGILKVDRLRTEISKTVHLFFNSFGLITPPLNHHLCLWQLIGRLHLPIEVFAASFKLAHLLHMDFDFKTNRAKWLSRAFEFPDHRLSALLVVTTKILFPLDGRDRPPKRPTEPAAIIMNWDSWVAAKDQKDHITESSYQRALRTTNKDVAAMSESRLDEYLKWFETMFTTNDPPSNGGRSDRDLNFRKSLQSMFPLHVSQAEVSDEEREPPDKQAMNDADSIKHVTSEMRPVRVLGHTASDDEDVNRPGSEYIRYRNASDMPQASTVAVFYAEVARVIGLTTDELCQSVFAVEKLMDKFLVQ
ncbi:Zinc-finger of RNA-polymerase I-specific TFIIB Rrn7-like protein [Elsinoe fawcettii]|nr:Zinc-finger of RNA-polymerase I-specific TFIIB Rrn7-like protein [Elsinoe fawcettii]